MTIKERKRILYFLEAFMVNLESHDENNINPEFLNLFFKKGACGNGIVASQETMTKVCLLKKQIQNYWNF